MLDIITVLIVILFMLLTLYREIMQPALVFLLAVIVFYFTGILSMQEILHGMSNENIILIFLLIIISEIIKKSAVLDILINKLLKPTLSYRSFIARLSGLVSFFSAWINNTPLVAFMMPYVYNWADKKGISTSRVMIPLSYAALMGGTITLIGTSTNLIVNGLSVESGREPLYIFNFAWVGIPATLLGILYLVFVGSRLLPSRKHILESFAEKTREYMVETIVPPMSNLTGRTIEAAGLRNLKDIYLIQIVREEEIIAPVSPKEVIRKNDRLFFVGNTERIIGLVEGNKHLILPYGAGMINKNDNNIIEVIVTNNSKLHNQTAKEFDFRKKYDAAIIAIQRNGEKLSGKIGETKLKTGDLLLLVAGQNFSSERDEDFSTVTRVKQIEKTAPWKIWLFFTLLLAAFVLAVAKILSLFISLLVVIAYTAVVDMIKLEQVKKTIDFNLFFILVLALAVGRAISNSGAADVFASSLMSLTGEHVIWSLIALYIITNITSMFVTNAAAVAITFPVAMSVATNLGLSDFRPFILLIAYAASAEFMTPFGYQTNLMVYGPGGYKFRDFIKVGFPLSLIYLIVTIVVLSMVFDLH